MKTPSEIKSKPLFESVLCPRCGGTGHYSFNFRHGTICYGCSGRGWKLTKRGAAAQAFYNTFRQKKNCELTPGTLFYGDGITMGGDLYYRWMRVVSNDVENHSLIYMDGKQEVKLEYMDDGGRPVLVKFATKEEQDSARAAALEYQENLTKAGTVRKHTKKGIESE